MRFFVVQNAVFDRANARFGGNERLNCPPPGKTGGKEMAEAKVNDFLEKERLGKLMVKYCVPCVIALLVATLYNIVDQILISNSILLLICLTDVLMLLLLQKLHHLTP